MVTHQSPCDYAADIRVVEPATADVNEKITIIDANIISHALGFRPAENVGRNREHDNDEYG